MATRAQRFRAAEERRGKVASKRRRAGSRPGVAPEDRARRKPRVARKAPFALEEGAGRPSRRSTRSSANRAKPDSNFNRRESMVKNAPDARFRRASARGARARGGADRH